MSVQNTTYLVRRNIGHILRKLKFIMGKIIKLDVLRERCLRLLRDVFI